jgi:DNA-directed RNA polymerase specialized sigma24 family protein
VGTNHFRLTDNELYIGIAEKKNEAFLFLYNHHINSIIKMVKQNSGTEDDALDIFQEGMVAIWVNIKNGKYNLDAWH